MCRRWSFTARLRRPSRRMNCCVRTGQEVEETWSEIKHSWFSPLGPLLKFDSLDDDGLSVLNKCSGTVVALPETMRCE